MIETWRLIREKDTTTARGLAVDDMIARSVATGHSAGPILHIYNFVPSAIVGRYQDIESSLDLDACRELGVEFNRRHTGGGTVMMGPEQLALGFAISLDDSRIAGKIRNIFEQLGGYICKALARLGVNASFRPKNDLEVGGRKVAGLSASLEERSTLFFHMSLLLDFDVERMLKLLNIPKEKLADKIVSCFQKRMTYLKAEGAPQSTTVSEVQELIIEEFAKAFEVEFKDTELSPHEKGIVREMRAERYENDDWIFLARRPQRRMGQASVKTPGGMVSAHIAMQDGAIESLMLTGDFFTTSELLNRIESELKWVKLDAGKLLKTFSNILGEDGIHAVTPKVLTGLVMTAAEEATEKAGLRE